MNKKIKSDEVIIPESNISVYEALYGRRMAWKFTEQDVPDEILNRILDTAVWAPNHRLNEPWRFFVIGRGSDLRNRVAQLTYDVTAKDPAELKRADGYHRAITNAPLLLYVYYYPGDNDSITLENYGATACALHNIALAGYAEGLSVTWETGRMSRVPGLQALLGADPQLRVLSMVTIGYPATSLSSSRTPVSEFVRRG
jgi:nitroreductase